MVWGPVTVWGLIALSQRGLSTPQSPGNLGFPPCSPQNNRPRGEKPKEISSSPWY